MGRSSAHARVRSRLAAATILAISAIPLLASSAAAADLRGSVGLTAVLNGRSVELAAVARLHCQDLSFPVIRCFDTDAELDASLASEALLAGVAYVKVFDFAGYGGASMVVSEDYPVLATLGWNDRISSFKALNSETGAFHIDWFYGGTTWSFCCNQTLASLGAYDNSFSSVRRT